MESVIYSVLFLSIADIFEEITYHEVVTTFLLFLRYSSSKVWIQNLRAAWFKVRTRRSYICNVATTVLCCIHCIRSLPFIYPFCTCCISVTHPLPARCALYVVTRRIKMLYSLSDTILISLTLPAVSCNVQRFVGKCKFKQTDEEGHSRR